MLIDDRIARRMKLHDLHVLMAVVQAGSMNKAAAALNMSQPAVSRSIAELERTVGVGLLDRSARGVEPTAYGRALLDGGTAVFDDLRQTLTDIRFLADPTAGEVRIGCSSILATSFVSAVIERLSARYPKIVFQLTIARIEVLHRELRERNVDVVIAQRLGPIADEHLDFEFIFDASFVVAAGAQNRWARRRKVSLEELLDEPWTLPPRASALGSVTAGAFRACGLDHPRATVFVIPTEVRINLLMTGRYLTILAGFALRFSAWRSAIKVLPIQLPIDRVQVGIVTLSNRALSPVARLFVDASHEVAKPLAKANRGYARPQSPVPPTRPRK
jgi:DNA-binding transcriptional LysR family regulator